MNQGSARCPETSCGSSSGGAGKLAVCMLAVATAISRVGNVVPAFLKQSQPQGATSPDILSQFSCFDTAEKQGSCSWPSLHPFTAISTPSFGIPPGCHYLVPSLAHTWLHNDPIQLTAAAAKQPGRKTARCHSRELNHFST